jgi:hypothetical protein
MHAESVRCKELVVQSSRRKHAADVTSEWGAAYQAVAAQPHKIHTCTAYEGVAVLYAGGSL